MFVSISAATLRQFANASLIPKEFNSFVDAYKSKINRALENIIQMRTIGIKLKM